MDALLEVSIDGFRFKNESRTHCKLSNNNNNNNNNHPPSDDSEDFAVLKYINKMLMEEEEEEDVEGDSLALQAAERSFYQILHHQNPTWSESLTTTRRSRCRPRNDNNDDDDDDDDDNDGFESSRIKKQPLISIDMELPEKFEDLLLLCTGQDQKASSNPNQNRTGRGKSSSSSQMSNPEPIDIRGLLMQCAQTVASFDHKKATERLKEIRSYADKNGNGTQRLAFYFAEGLETRIAGCQSRPQMFNPNPFGRTSMVKILNAYKLFIQACPVKKMSYFVANKTIFNLSLKSTKIHIIDFGILYGFQWPCLIQALSNRPGGPPLLRVTGIDLPQPGFRPSDRLEQTGRRLKRFCERFKVPFKYTFIAKKWESIDLDELMIDQDEFTVVNSLYRLRYTPDETVSMNSPRDLVLKLIKDINPNLFVFGEINGMYNSPFFLTRFRESLFHFSSLFDMIEATMGVDNDDDDDDDDDEYRTLLEKELFMRDAVNVIAFEGVERVDRP